MLIDTTLREGEQLYGVYFTDRTRRALLLRLHAAGVEEAEVGCVGRAGLAALVEYALERCPGMAVGVWCPCREDTLAQAAALGASHVNVGVPVSDLHLRERLAWTREQLKVRVRNVLAAAARLGIRRISLGLEDATRADAGFVAEVAELARRHGAFRVRLSDTVGHGTPDQMRELVAGVAARSVPVAVHCHNDFGMGTANAVTALRAGADWADVSLLGIGERAGIAATEEVAAYLALAAGEADYDVAALRGACRLVSTAADVAVARTRPVTGRDIFRCETGLHVHGIARRPALFEPYDPERVGAERRTALGGKSGRAAVLAVLRGRGVEPTPEELAEAVALVRAEALALGRPLAEGDLDRLWPRTGARGSKSAARRGASLA
ncbi:MAG: LeuA family protein [Desulfovibrionaceae bacterium]